MAGERQFGLRRKECAGEQRAIIVGAARNRFGQVHFAGHGLHPLFRDFVAVGMMTARGFPSYGSW